MEHDRRFNRRNFNGGAGGVGARPRPYMNVRNNNFWSPRGPSGPGNFNPGWNRPPGPGGPPGWSRAPLNFRNEFLHHPRGPPPPGEDSCSSSRGPPTHEPPQERTYEEEGAGTEGDDPDKTYAYSNSLSAIMSSLSRDPQVLENERKRRSDGWNVPLSSVIDKGAFPLPKKKFKFMDNLYCEVCNIELTSETVMQSHITGMRHLKKLQNLKRMNPARAEELDMYGFQGVTERRADFLGTAPKRRVPGTPGALAKLLENSDQPVVGAEFLEEYSAGPDAKFEPVYYCTLCSAHALYEIMYQHVIGVKHRTKYMKELHDQENLTKSQLRQEASRIERENGRQLTKIKTITGLTAPPDFGKLKTEKTTDKPSDKPQPAVASASESQEAEEHAEKENVLVKVEAAAVAGESEKGVGEDLGGIEVIVTEKPPPPVVDVDSVPTDAEGSRETSSERVTSEDQQMDTDVPSVKTKQERLSDSEEDERPLSSLIGDATSPSLGVAGVLKSDIPDPPAVPSQSQSRSSSALATLVPESGSRLGSSTPTPPPVSRFVVPDESQKPSPDQKPIVPVIVKKIVKCDCAKTGGKGKKKPGIGENRVGGIIGSLIGCTIKVESDMKLAVNVSGSLVANLLSWHKEDEAEGVAKELEERRKCSEAIPILESILDNIKKYVDMIQVPGVIDLIKNREIVKHAESETTTGHVSSNGDSSSSPGSAEVKPESGVQTEAVITPTLTQIPGFPGVMMVLPTGNVEQLQEFMRQFADGQKKSSGSSTSTTVTTSTTSSSSAPSSRQATTSSTAAIPAGVPLDNQKRTAGVSEAARETNSASPAGPDSIDPQILSAPVAGPPGSSLSTSDPLMSLSFAPPRQLANARDAELGYRTDSCSPPSSVLKDRLTAGLSSMVGVAFSPVSDGNDDEPVGFDDALMACLSTPSTSPPVSLSGMTLPMLSATLPTMNIPMTMSMPMPTTTSLPSLKPDTFIGTSAPVSTPVASTSSGSYSGNGGFSSSFLPSILTDGDVRYSLSPCWTNTSQLLSTVQQDHRQTSSYPSHVPHPSSSSAYMQQSTARTQQMPNMPNFHSMSSGGNLYETGLPPMTPFEPPLESLAPSTIDLQPHAQRGHCTVISPEDAELFSVARMKGKMKLSAKYSSQN